MRLAIFAAAAAIGMSAPAAAATWVFEVTTTFNITGNQIRYLCMGNPADCFFDTPINKQVTETYQLSVESFSGFATNERHLLTFAGYGLDPRASILTTVIRLGGGRAFVESALVEGGDMGCRLGRPPCSEVMFRGTGSNSSIAFVSSSDATVPVPEPTTWAMMIGGFGMVGSAMRYRRRKISVSFA